MMNNNSIRKIPKLTAAEDYVDWKRPFKADVQTEGVDLFDLADRSDNTSATRNIRCVKSNGSAERFIILTFCNGPLEQISIAIGDDEKIAKEL